MKKSISIILAFIFLFSVTALFSCSRNKDKTNTENSMKLGLAVHSDTESPSNANGELNGKGILVTTAAAVLLDSDGKIVKCVIDCAEAEAAYSSSGKYVPTKEFKTKRELGDSYGMKAVGGAAKEWYEQVDALTSLAIGKTRDEIKSLADDSGKGNSEVIKAGCTIDISEFIYVLDKAIASAETSSATDKDTLELIITTAQSGKDADSGTDGYNEVVSDVTLKLLGSDNKTISEKKETSKATFTFDISGKATQNKTNN